MPLRAFYDQSGVRWEVWEAHPRLAERRSPDDRRVAPRAADDRRRCERRAPATHLEEDGWLVFHSPNERRRQRPIPVGWDTLADGDLEALMWRSRPSGPRSRVTE